jgi:hypothetical protein
MQSYSAVGQITSSFIASGLPSQDATCTFSIRLARPELYRIEWEQRLPNFVTKGALWSSGQGHFLLIPGQADRQQAKDLSTALAMGTGISGGAANTIPSTFFALDHSPLKTLSGATLVRDESFEGDPCYVINGRAAHRIGVTVWISKKSGLVRQVQTDYDGPMEMPEISDEEVKKVLESMNRDQTAEAVELMKEQLQSARKMMSRGLTGYSKEVHRGIKIDEPLPTAEFVPTIAGDPH